MKTAVEKKHVKDFFFTVFKNTRILKKKRAN